jgi:hypothetical protein
MFVTFALAAFLKTTNSVLVVAAAGADWFSGRGRLQPDFLHLRGPLPVMVCTARWCAVDEPVAQNKMIAFEDTVWYLQ